MSAGWEREGGGGLVAGGWVGVVLGVAVTGWAVLEEAATAAGAEEKGRVAGKEREGWDWAAAGRGAAAGRAAARAQAGGRSRQR